MSALAPTLQAFFTVRLVNQKQASAHTVTAYRDTFCLLLGFAQRSTGKTPSALDFADLDATVIGAFLDHLESHRHNSIATRNARLAAIHSMFRYAALQHPEHADLIGRVLAIPTKRADRSDVSFLDDAEIDALIAAPDRGTWTGRRDHALLVTALQTGLRVAELTGVSCEDVHLGTGAHIRCTGKGRKQRCTPLTGPTVAVLRTWFKERQNEPGAPLFPTSRGRRLSTDAVAWAVAKHAKTAQATCATLKNKTVTPHVLRHSA
ncbi:MAG: tyrosine-type recombinase/integrase, partial [Mycobacterium sp.]